MKYPYSADIDTTCVLVNPLYIYSYTNHIQTVLIFNYVYIRNNE